ncbi:MAG TPA: ABC transporter permease [Dissulfurispiraceae bacterium]|nr:ABC transporter permease [Dissulfurispiraceae bacterium]
MPESSHADVKPPQARVVPRADESAVVRLSGEWTMALPLPPVDDTLRDLSSLTAVRRVAFDSSELARWDSSLLTFLLKMSAECAQLNIPMDQEGLPEGARRLFRLATAVPERAGARKETARVSFLAQAGDTALSFQRGVKEMLAFLGEAMLALFRLFVGKARFRRSDLFVIIQECGAQALPIVSLISFLVGLILAFIGAIQLKIFGAQIYVASLVGIGMVRALAAVMTGIIMAGRTGASFAAQLGTMQVNEEIDALRTLGISPVEFLVLPRMLALSLMMPLLSLYADLLGVLGGVVIGVFMLDLNFMEYYLKTQESVKVNDFWVGLFSAAVFGVLVALSGCLRGMQCGRSASAVGEAATSAVVTGIVSIVVATAVITVVCHVLGI